MKNWFISKNRFIRVKGYYWIIPCISFWYDSYHFLETEITSPAIGIQVAFLNFTYGLTIQKGY